MIASQRVTTAERQVLQYVALGKTSPEIGVILGRSERTVERHIENMFRKFDCGNRLSLLLATGFVKLT